jgi:hypothetical protein
MPAAAHHDYSRNSAHVLTGWAVYHRQRRENGTETDWNRRAEFACSFRVSSGIQKNPGQFTLDEMALFTGQASAANLVLKFATSVNGADIRAAPGGRSPR